MYVCNARIQASQPIYCTTDFTIQNDKEECWIKLLTGHPIDSNLGCQGAVSDAMRKPLTTTGYVSEFSLENMISDPRNKGRPEAFLRVTRCCTSPSQGIQRQGSLQLRVRQCLREEKGSGSRMQHSYARWGTYDCPLVALALVQGYSLSVNRN